MASVARIPRKGGGSKDKPSPEDPDKSDKGSKGGKRQRLAAPEEPDAEDFSSSMDSALVVQTVNHFAFELVRVTNHDHMLARLEPEDQQMVAKIMSARQLMAGGQP